MKTKKEPPGFLRMPIRAPVGAKINEVQSDAARHYDFTSSFLNKVVLLYI